MDIERRRRTGTSWRRRRTERGEGQGGMRGAGNGIGAMEEERDEHEDRHQDRIFLHEDTRHFLQLISLNGCLSGPVTVTLFVALLTALLSCMSLYRPVCFVVDVLNIYDPISSPFAPPTLCLSLSSSFSFGFLL